MLFPQVFAYYGLMSPSRYLPPAYLFRPGGSLSYGLIATDTERIPNLLRLSFPPCRRPYPGSRMELTDCSFSTRIGLRLLCTGSASAIYPPVLYG